MEGHVAQNRNANLDHGPTFLPSNKQARTLPRSSRQIPNSSPKNMGGCASKKRRQAAEAAAAASRQHQQLIMARQGAASGSDMSVASSNTKEIRTELDLTENKYPA